MHAASTDVKHGRMDRRRALAGGFRVGHRPSPNRGAGSIHCPFRRKASVNVDVVVLPRRAPGRTHRPTPTRARASGPYRSSLPSRCRIQTNRPMPGFVSRSTTRPPNTVLTTWPLRVRNTVLGWKTAMPMTGCRRNPKGRSIAAVTGGGRATPSGHAEAPADAGCASIAHSTAERRRRGLTTPPPRSGRAPSPPARRRQAPVGGTAPACVRRCSRRAGYDLVRHWCRR